MNSIKNSFLKNVSHSKSNILSNQFLKIDTTNKLNEWNTYSINPRNNSLLNGMQRNAFHTSNIQLSKKKLKAKLQFYLPVGKASTGPPVGMFIFNEE